MGNAVASCDFAYSRKSKQLKTCLKPEQIQLVQNSWDYLKHDLTDLGLLVFKRFFETEPDMKAIFPKIIKINNDNKLEWDVDQDMLQKHAVTVMEGLGAAVECLEDSNFLNSVLIAVGQTHIERQVKPQMLKRLWPSLNYGLQKTLGDIYSKQVMIAWKRVYDYICVYMKVGMENPDMDPDAPFELDI